MSVMFDWVTAVVPLANASELNDGRIVSTDNDGVIQWTAVRRLQVVGSHASALQLRGRHDDALEFSGNPSKFLQGHNLFGPAELVPLMNRTLLQLAGQLGLTPTDENLSDWASGAYTLSRIDTAGMIPFVSDKDVRKVLDLLGQTAKTKYQGATVRSGTVYIGQNSRRISLKLYSKGEEITSKKKGHALATTVAPHWHQNLLHFAQGKLRAELTMRGLELKERGLHHAARWSQAIASDLLRERMATLELNDTISLAHDLVHGLPSKLVPVYHAWKAGTDLQNIYCRSTFYRYRKALLSYGIDIGRVQPHIVEPENQYPLGVPLRDILASPFADVPDWAIGTELLAS